LNKDLQKNRPATAAGRENGKTHKLSSWSRFGLDIVERSSSLPRAPARLVAAAAPKDHCSDNVAKQRQGVWRGALAPLEVSREPY